MIRAAIVEDQPHLEKGDGWVQHPELSPSGAITTRDMTAAEKAAAKKRETKRPPFGFGATNADQ